MTMSPTSSLLVSSCSVASTTPAGTISQTARGLLSFLTKSSSEEEPVAPSRGELLHGIRAAVEDHALDGRLFASRRTMLAPILPSPIMPSCIACAPQCFDLW